MLTDNEKKVIREILFSFNENSSINEIAGKLKISPNGTYKILNKLEAEDILIAKRISNIKSYKLNFNEPKTESIIELSLIKEANLLLKNRTEDLQETRKYSICCIAFGSYIKIPSKAKDIDLLFIIEKSNFKMLINKINEARHICPIKIHEIIQTDEDLKENIFIAYSVALQALKEGIVLWGHRELVGLVKDVYKRKVV